ncbi:SDR family NAD(P)-dependent oxidoreductase [Cryptosporangium phraense]|uniref:SDR family NAD(P)-dependent oxidoreductase n=1 Tax=Cryptosporangium phraense TaxID=2593070 RepID=A0A545AI31_9ACTN|nr:SDR family NAD(P)-dependent oxidoreductase [Cryptosporangium phraense]TQS40976.1 SDR family NAD(P)-dependent oxidoreductase [Cryptosporangium phraense]
MMSQKSIALVTGATGGMGRVLVRSLAGAGNTVVAVARSAARADELREAVAPLPVEVLIGDLSSRDDVFRLAQRFTTLNLLINNAGAHFRHRTVNADGIEMHVAVNYLGGYLLTELLRPALLAGAPARVVNVVSASLADTRQVKIRRRPRPVGLGDLRALTDVNPEAGFTAYARSKLLTLMAGYRLAEELDGTGVTVNSVHPGVVGTDIVDDMTPAYLRLFGGLIKRSLLTPEEGAASILRVAGLSGVTGRYFDRDVEARSSEVSYDRALQERLLAISRPYLS